MVRPTIVDVDFKKIAGEIVSDLEEWMKIPSDRRESCITDIESAIRNVYSLDGYELAKHLADQGWNPDTQLVNALKVTRGRFNYDLRQRVKQWVIDNDIAPSLSKGDSVKYKDQKGIHSGEITDINYMEATYMVRVKDLGHGEYDGLMVNCEDLENGNDPKKTSGDIRATKILNEWVNDSGPDSDDKSKRSYNHHYDAINHVVKIEKVTRVFDDSIGEGESFSGEGISLAFTTAVKNALSGLK